MATLKASRTAQWPLTALFTIDLASGDAMLNTSGVLTNFKAAAGVFDVIPLPPGAFVVGGYLMVETVSNESGTATLKVGDSGNDARYLGATSIKSAAATALVPTGYRSAGENIRITLANQNGDASAGKVTVAVQYVVANRSNEVQIT